MLVYNLIHWLGGNLPWESKLGDPIIVHQIKEDNLNDIPKFVTSCLKKNQETIIKFLEYVTKLKFDQKPNYKKIRSFFEDEIEKSGATVYSALDLSGERKRRRAGDESDSDLAESRELKKEKEADKKKKTQSEKDKSDEGGKKKKKEKLRRR